MSGDVVAGRHGRPRQPLEEIPQEYAAFKIEQRGIDLIPDAERKMTPSGLFWLWSGAVFNVEFFFYGTLIMFFGLDVLQAVAAILIGNLFYALLGFASLQGPKRARPRSWSAGRRWLEREPDGGAVQLGHPGRLRDRGHLLRRRHRHLAVLAARHQPQRAGQDRGDHHRRAVADDRAAAGARHDQQGPALPGLRVHRVLRGPGRVHLQQAAPVHLPRPSGVVRGVDHRAGADHLHRRPGLDRERQRLLALPAA